MTYEKIRDRYLRNYITDSQLQRFVDRGIITQDQYDTLYSEKHGVNAESLGEDADD